MGRNHDAGLLSPDRASGNQEGSPSLFVFFFISSRMEMKRKNPESTRFLHSSSLHWENEVEEGGTLRLEPEDGLELREQIQIPFHVPRQEELLPYGLSPFFPEAPAQLRVFEQLHNPCGRLL